MRPDRSRDRDRDLDRHRHRHGHRHRHRILCPPLHALLFSACPALLHICIIIYTMACPPQHALPSSAHLTSFQLSCLAIQAIETCMHASIGEHCGGITVDIYNREGLTPCALVACSGELATSYVHFKVQCKSPTSLLSNCVWKALKASDGQSALDHLMFMLKPHAPVPNGWSIKENTRHSVITPVCFVFPVRGGVRGQI